MDDMGFADIVPLVAEDSLYSTLSRSTRRAPALGIRSVSYSFVESELSKGHDDRFGDLSPSSPFSSFSPSKPDFEDLFY